MNETQDWRGMIQMSARLLEERTGEDVETWKKRIETESFNDEQPLRKWLGDQGVTGYAQSLLIWERFGYPGFMLASADDLIDGQYSDRPHLRPILDAILTAAMSLGAVTIQARKTYVSLVSPRRTFARIQPTTRQRIDLGLRLEGIQPGGRLVPSKINETMPLQVSLQSPEDVDAEVLDWLQRTYEQNR